MSISEKTQALFGYGLIGLNTDEAKMVSRDLETIYEEVQQLQAEKKRLQKVIEDIVTALSVMANTTSEEGIRELPALAKELKSNTRQILKEGE